MVRVLVAEDTYVHLALLGYILSQEIDVSRLETKLTGDGREAVIELMNSIIEDKINYDLIILDYSMPVINGLQVV